MSRARVRVWALYGALWVPVAIFYAVLIGQTRGVSRYNAALSGVAYVIPAALVGVAVWWLSAVLVWPTPKRLRFFVVHTVLAAVSSALWLGFQIAWIAWRSGDLQIALDAAQFFAGWQMLSGLWTYGLLGVGAYAIRIASRLREQEGITARAEALRVRAELSALRGQLNPHFLFNTLHTVTALVRRDPATAEHALERFGDLLRYVLDVKRAAREDVTFGDEMSFVRNYLALEQLRFGERLRVRETIDPDAYDCVLPSLTLQPLIENAIKYGVAPRASGGSVEIRAAVDDTTLSIEVADDGPGAPAAVAQNAAGMGLRVVRQRIETRYGRDASFAVATGPGEGFVVRVSIPAHTGVNAESRAPAAT